MKFEPVVKTVAAARSAWLIIAAGLAVRLILLLLFDPTQFIVSGDTNEYLFHPFSGFRAPLYGAFLLVLYPLGWWAPMVVQCALTIGSGVAAEKVLKGRAGLTCGLLIAACPFFAIYDFRLMSESLYIPLLWLGFLALYARKPILSGLLVGLAILTRDTLIVLPLLVAAAALLRPKSERRPWWVATAVAYLMIAPWLAVNGSISQGRMGLNLWAGTWERNDRWYVNGLDRPDFPPYAFASRDEERFVRTHWPDDASLKRAGIQRIASDPVATAAAWADRYPHMWIDNRDEQISYRAEFKSPAWIALKLFFGTLNLLLLAFGIWGLLKPKLLFAAPVAYAAVIYIPFHAEPRYTLFALPFLIALGALRLHHATAPSRQPLAGEAVNLAAI